MTRMRSAEKDDQRKELLNLDILINNVGFEIRILQFEAHDIYEKTCQSDDGRTRSQRWSRTLQWHFNLDP